MKKKEEFSDVTVLVAQGRLHISGLRNGRGFATTRPWLKAADIVFLLRRIQATTGLWAELIFVDWIHEEWPEFVDKVAQMYVWAQEATN